jgi:hypothetical protein
MEYTGLIDWLIGWFIDWTVYDVFIQLLTSKAVSFTDNINDFISEY